MDFANWRTAGRSTHEDGSSQEEMSASRTGRVWRWNRVVEEVRRREPVRELYIFVGKG